MPMKKIFLIMFIAISVISCKKEPGEGGFASIEGKLYVQEYDDFFKLKYQNIMYQAKTYTLYMALARK